MKLGPLPPDQLIQPESSSPKFHVVQKLMYKYPIKTSID
jgi:hypothetical protein